MSLWSLLDGGYSMPQNKTPGQRLALWVGRRLANRHPGVALAPTCRISPEARIHPRNGKISIGEACTVAMGAVIQGPVQMGRECSVQAYSMLIAYGSGQNPGGQITLGDFVRIGPGVMMFAGNHNFADHTAPIHGQGLTLAPITIEDDVWIASRVVITAGVTIGRGSVIAAGAVLTKDVPSYSVVGGVPARVLKSRMPDGDTVE